MDSELKRKLRALSLALRHILERDVEKPGDLHLRLNQIGVWPDRPAIPVHELVLTDEDRVARATVDAFLAYREGAGVRDDAAFREFVRESAYSWANRLFTLRCLEARGLIDPAVVLQQKVYGGRSLAHYRFVRDNPGACSGDDDGLFAVLSLAFARHASELPAVFDPGAPGIALRPSVPALKRCIALLSGQDEDDTLFQASDVLGWAYQFWNAEEKDRVFERVRTEKNAKIAGADLIPATQLYTEPYMVKFLVQNSLGAFWVGMNPESSLAATWKYYLEDADRTPPVHPDPAPFDPQHPPQQGTDPWVRPNPNLRPDPEVIAYAHTLAAKVPNAREDTFVGLRNELLDAAIERTPVTLLDLNRRVCEAWDLEWPARRPKLHKPASEIAFLDPACGSGHFLLEAFDLFYEMYREEDPALTPEEISAAILSRNLYGIDIDERAIQIAHAALWMHARERAPELRPQAVAALADHLVAANLALPRGTSHIEKFLAQHPDDAPLASALQAVFDGLADADQLGSLLRIEEPVEQELQRLKAAEDLLKAQLLRQAQGKLEFLSEQYVLEEAAPKRDYGEWKREVLLRVKEHFRQEAGLSDPVQAFFDREAQRGLALFDLLARRYDVVAANPPYMGRDKSSEPLTSLLDSYQGAADMYGAFIERGIQLSHFNGYVGILSLANYLHSDEFVDFRHMLIRDYRIEALANLSNKTFETLSNPNAFYFCMIVLAKLPPDGTRITVVDLAGTEYEQKQESLLTCVKAASDSCRRFFPRQDSFYEIPNVPIAYRLPEWGRNAYLNRHYVSNVAEARQGLSTGKTERFLRYRWECGTLGMRWHCHAKGGAFRRWWGNNHWAIDWEFDGVRVRNFTDEDGKLRSAPRNIQYFGRDGCTWSSQTISAFAVRRIEPRSCFDTTGSTAFPKLDGHTSTEDLLAVFNCPAFGDLFSAIQPGVHFGEGYLETLPFPSTALPLQISRQVVECIEFQQAADRHLTRIWNGSGRGLSLGRAALLSLAELTQLELRLHAVECDLWDSVECALGVPTPERTTTRRFRLQDPLATNELLLKFASVRPRPTVQAWRATQNRSEELSASIGVHPRSLERNLIQVLEQAKHDNSTIRPLITEHLELQVESVILSFFGYSQTAHETSIVDSPNPEGIITLSDTLPSRAPLLRRVSEFLDRVFDRDAIVEFEEVVGCSLGRWLGRDFFPRHISDFLSRPIAWQLETRPVGRGASSVLSCLIYYHRIAGALPELRKVFAGTLRTSYETERRSLDLLPSLTIDQKDRKEKLDVLIEEVRDFEVALERVESDGFFTEKLRSYAIEDAVLSMARRWLGRLRDAIRGGPLGAWRELAASADYPPQLPTWLSAAVDRVDRQCVAIAPRSPRPETSDDELKASAIAGLFSGGEAAMVRHGLHAICSDWQAEYDKSVVQPLKNEIKAANELLETLPETVENKLRRNDLKLHVKRLRREVAERATRARVLSQSIEEWRCPEAETWFEWLSTQPLYDEVSSPDGKRQPPQSVSEFVAQESQYQPDINDGVRVNIAPLQKAGLLARDVLAFKDVDKAIADRAEWRADERRWVRQRILPKPGWWPAEQERSCEAEGGR